MKNRLPIWDLVERAQAEVACRILENALLERQYALRKDAKEEQSLLPERTPKRKMMTGSKPVAICPPVSAKLLQS
jgi:hypothetical protein